MRIPLAKQWVSGNRGCLATLAKQWVSGNPLATRGGKVRRPGLERVHDALRSGDVLAVWRLDRLGRSLEHLIELMGELEAERIGFQSVTESIDTTTPGGKLVFHILGARGV
jgi:DNA invertase Pin-like site-specific DNA recombinase